MSVIMRPHFIVFMEEEGEDPQVSQDYAGSTLMSTATEVVGYLRVGKEESFLVIHNLTLAKLGKHAP